MRKLMRYFRDLRLSTKLFLSCMFISILPLIVLGSYSYSQASSFQLEQARVNLLHNVEKIGNSINSRANQYQMITDSILTNFQYKKIFNLDEGDSANAKSDSDYIDPFFNNILYINNDILQITVFSNKAELVHGDYIKSIKLVLDMPWYHDATATGNICWFSQNNKLLCLRSFQNLSPEKGSSSAILFLSIDTDKLFSSLSEGQAHGEGGIVINKNGQVVFGDHIDPQIIGKISALDYSKKTAEYSMGGKRYFVVKEEIDIPGWNLYYFVPINSISVNTEHIVMATEFIVIICFIVITLLVFALSRSFVSRLRRLIRAMESVENGSFNVTIHTQSNDEIGVLTTRFNDMIVKIKALIEEVYESHITQKEAEMKALQAQINPHFLYNSLSIVNWKAIQIDATDISDIINTISKYYRTVLNKGKNTISIADEVQNTNLYMKIQLIMHNNSFDFLCSVDDEIVRYDMLNLILQPILENAIEHGIDRKRKGSERGVISLRGYMTENAIEFAVEDNGPGMPEGTAMAVLSQDTAGYGLKNVNDRIKLFFGSQYGLEIHSIENAGTTLYIRIPKYKS